MYRCLFVNARAKQITLIDYFECWNGQRIQFMLRYTSICTYFRVQNIFIPHINIIRPLHRRILFLHFKPFSNGRQSRNLVFLEINDPFTTNTENSIKIRENRQHISDVNFKLIKNLKSPSLAYILLLLMSQAKNHQIILTASKTNVLGKNKEKKSRVSFILKLCNLKFGMHVVKT